jgi:D-lactate dehydrogenase (cytochrome)
VAFPANESEVAALLTGAGRILPVGAQSSLTGGATPRGDIVLSTRALDRISPPAGCSIQVGAGVPLSELQNALAGESLYYPPLPTYDGAFVGGTIATNAAGAATFKYGATRDWVDALTVVLADGSTLRLRRGEVCASRDGWFEFERPNGSLFHVAVPSYSMPQLPKLSAGYYARPEMDLIDLFIGAEGTLGVIVDATVRVIPRPSRCIALVPCDSESQALAVTSALREGALRAWRGAGLLDVAAIEYMDSRTIGAVPDEVFARTGLTRPAKNISLLIVQLELPGDEEPVLMELQALLDEADVAADSVLAMPGDDRGAARFLELREAAPSAVNSLIAAAKHRVHPDIQKVAGDMIVPFDRLAESLTLYRSAFEARGLEYAIWGHVSDGNLHPNVLPRSLDDVKRGQDAILEIGRGVIAMHGAPLAEHGVGRSALKQRLLFELYGERGIEDMRRVKRALDPEWKLASGVLFPP